MKKLSAQEIFNKVVEHLRKQGKKARGTGYQCLYRAPNSKASNRLRCAAGCLIHDKFYYRGLEGNSVLDDEVSVALLSSGIARAQLPLVGGLQRIHDEYPPEGWEVKFRELAAQVNLRHTPPKK